jgi:hypothetical protein
MSHRRSTSSSAARLAATAAAAVIVLPSVARAQACCAGGSAITPARLETHEVALAGASVRADASTGSYDSGGHYAGAPSGDTEFDFEEDLFGAFRWLERGQAALLVPVVQTRRAVSSPDGSQSAFGGGIGDINVSGRYDFLSAGESRYVPGIALLAGITLPTGRAAESATAPLAVDATGIGAWQFNGALALEQTYGDWLFNLSGILAKRTARFGQTLGTQITVLAAGSYSFPNDMALALSLSYAFEGDATDANGDDVAFSSKRLTTVTGSFFWPIDDTLRLIGGVFVEPPVSHLGSNQPASSGLTITVIRSWS